VRLRQVEIPLLKEWLAAVHVHLDLRAINELILVTLALHILLVPFVKIIH
jgi:hypothetical protein